MKAKREDMEKLERAFFKNLQRNDCEYGGIGLDDKRPFGNSFVAGDILEIIGEQKDDVDGWTEEQLDYADWLYDKLIPWLQKKYLGL